jgi:hypothetical protein
MSDSMGLVSRYARFAGSLLINLFLAVFGTGALETMFGVLYHPNSIPLLLWKSVGMGLLFGVLLGGLMYKFFKPAAAKWVWILPAVWFCWRIFLFVSPELSFRYVWQQMSGTVCISESRAQGCGTTFFVFTLPLIRAIAYAAGAKAMMLLLKTQKAATDS